MYFVTSVLYEITCTPSNTDKPDTDSSGVQFTTYFIESFVVETKQFVGSFVNVILTRQTCGQRSSRAVESKRQAI